MIYVDQVKLFTNKIKLIFNSKLYNLYEIQLHLDQSVKWLNS